MPELFEVIVNTTEGIDDLPASDLPYYILAKEGMYLRRHTQIGDVFLKEYKTPETLRPLGYPSGVFLWDGEKIPGEIISQAKDFFKRILTKYNTEAEVLITMHNDTRAFRLFVPYQRTSHGGVKSIYEPTHIDRNYTVVGTLHSHCDFSAFHSGIDSGDASDMDGIHFTIGMLQKDEPEIVAMVAMGGKEFHYKTPSTIAEIVWDKATAPPWWDQYVYPATTESEKPKSLKSLTQAQWDSFRGLATPKPKTQVQTWKAPAGYQPHGSWTNPWVPSEDRSAVSYINKYMGQPLKESTKFNRDRSKKNLHMLTEDEIKIDLAIDEAEKWNLLHYDDYDGMTLRNASDLDYWRTLFLIKIDTLCDILDTLDTTIEFTIKPKKEKR
jgi:proteasome lid subunit RPN8/RPN11